MLTSKQRAKLRALANPLDTIFQIGKAQPGEALFAQVGDALEKRELIKLRVLETAPLSSREAADLIAGKTGADVVQVIGSRFVLYKESKDNKQIDLKN